MKVHVQMDDDSPVTTTDYLDMSMADALDGLHNFGRRITRLQEVATPDANGIGVYVLIVHFDSMLIGSRITFIS